MSLQTGMSCFWLLSNRGNLPALFTLNLLGLVRKAFIIFTALLCVLSHFVSFAFITFVAADDQHHSKSCLQFLSKKTGPEIWTSWMYWHVPACPMPSFTKAKVVTDTSPQLWGPTVKRSVLCMSQPFGQTSSLTAWEDPCQNKQQREDVDGNQRLWNKTRAAMNGSQDLWAILCCNFWKSVLSSF